MKRRRRTIGLVVGTVMVALELTMLIQASLADWVPEYAQAPQWVQDWYRNAQLTDAAQKRFPFKNCCDHSEVAKTQFAVRIVDGQDEWHWLDRGRWRIIPPDIIHWGESAPDGQPTLFLYNGEETCFFPGRGGI